jgi:DNA-binding YbaB/EbfC family protein
MNDFSKFLQGGFGNILQQAQRVSQDLQKIQNELQNKCVEGNAGGGKVVAVANGHQQILRLRIDPEVISNDPEDIALLEDMIVGAINLALEKSKTLALHDMGNLTGGLNLQNVMEMFQK